MRRSPAYIETPQIRLPPAVNISHQNIRGVHSEHTQNFIYPSLKCKWPIHTKLLAPNDLISLSYRTQYCVWNDNVYYELKKKIDWNILVLPDQCSRTFWAFSRYRYRDTMSLEIFAQSKTVSRDQQKIITVRVWVHFGLTILTYTCVNFLHKKAPGTAESDIMREKMHGKQTGTQLGARPLVHYDVTGIYRHIPPGHANKCSNW